MADSREHCHDDCSEHEHDRWIEIERVYQEKSSEEKSLVNWFIKNVDVYFSPANRQNNEVSSKKFSILSFGCGNGTKDRAILLEISCRLSEDAKVLYHAVDPAAGEIEKFKKAVRNENESQQRLKKVDFGFYAQTYETYMESTFKSEESRPFKANLILFIDSLCHFSSLTEDALVHCYDNVLTQNGVILVTLWNDEDFWFKIREIYGKSNERTAEEGNDYLTIQEVQKLVKKLGWKFELFPPEYSLDVTECFNPDSQIGKCLLDCLACFSNVKEEADSDPKKLLKFLQDTVSMSGDKYMLKGKHGVLTIYKH